MQIPVEVLVQQLQQIPGIHVTIDYEELAGQQKRFGPNTTFETWAIYWLETYKRGVVKDNTYQSTYHDPVYLHLIPFFGPQAISGIYANEVQEFFKTKINSSALESQKKMRVALRAIFDAAIDNGLCWRNPVTSSLRILSNVKPVEKHTWSKEEYELAKQYALGHPAGLGILILMETGMSRSELLGLRWCNYDAKKRTLWIESGLVAVKDSMSGRRKLIAEGTKNKYRKREIPLSPLLNGLLSLKPRYVQLKKEKKYTVHIIHSPEGKPYDPTNWYRRSFKPFMRDCYMATGITQLTPHELRHTRATLLKDDGVDIFSIARLLGHSNLDMLAKRYAHDNVETVRKALGLAEMPK